MNDWGDAVRDDVIEALGFLNQVLNEAIDQRSDLQVAMVRSYGVIPQRHSYRISL